MELIKYLTVLACLSLAASEIQHSVTGRCCTPGKGGDCLGFPTKDDPPPIETTEGEEVQVIWEPQDLHCPPIHSIVHYDFRNESGNTFIVTENGLELKYHTGNVFAKKTREYCLDVKEGRYQAAVCRPDPEKMCDSGVCIPKCCGEGEVLQIGGCEKGIGNMSLQFYTFLVEPVPTPDDVVMVGDMVPICSDIEFLGFRYDISHQHLLLTGKLLDTKSLIAYEFTQYCVEDNYLGDDHSLQYLVCADEESKAMVVKHELQKVGFVISMIFLVVTILIYVFVPSLHDTQGLCLVSHMVAMLVSDIFLFMLSVVSYGISTGFCLFIGFGLLYFFLAMFFWLSVMCFDIWRVIRNTAKGIPLSGILGNDTKKFRLFSLYGWGVPLVIEVVAIIMHTLPEELAKTITPPGFGERTCWLLGHKEELLYCYGFIAALFILDLILIGHAMFLLFQAGSAFRCFSRQVSVTAFNRKHLEAFWQRFTLFILMVLCWTTEVLSWLIPPPEMWLVSDFANSMQGFFVFIIFISSKKRRDLAKGLLEKLPLPCMKSHKKTTPAGSENSNSKGPSTSGTGSGTHQEEISLDTVNPANQGQSK